MPGLGSCTTDLSVLGMNGAGESGQYNMDTTDQSIVGKDGAGQYVVSTVVGETPAVAPVICRNCLGTGRTLFGACVKCCKHLCV